MSMSQPCCESWLKAQEGELPPFKFCPWCGTKKVDPTVAIIFGSEVTFHEEVPLADVAARCKYIWNHASEFSDYKDDSEGAYYSFLKFLWVRLPKGEEKLSDIAIETEKFGEAETTIRLMKQ